jgi:hypothetical protein
MWIRVPRNIFLVVGAIVGVFVTAPFVLRYATVWWWLSVPAVLAYAAVLWRWGLAWLTDDADIDQASVPLKIGGVLILLAYSFVGLTLLIYLGGLAVQYWMMIVFSLIVCALIVLAVWLTTLGDKTKAPSPAAAPPPAPQIIAGGPPKPDNIVR